MYSMEIINKSDVPTAVYKRDDSPILSQNINTAIIEKEKYLYLDEQAILENRKMDTSNRGRVWYKKYYIFGRESHLSLRYFFIFEDKLEREKRWFLKDHRSKTYEEISPKMAKILIKDAKNRYGFIDFDEVIGFNEYGIHKENRENLGYSYCKIKI